jgi:phage terminase large subunit-like protein
MYALKASPGYLAYTLKILDLCTSLAKEDSLGLMAPEQHYSTPQSRPAPRAQHSLAWCDELAKWQYAEETWDQLQFGMRLGKHPRQIVATTPRPIPVLKRILADPSTVTTRGSTLNNKANLAPSFFTRL